MRNDDVLLNNVLLKNDDFSCSYVEIVSQYLEIHYEIQAQENYDNPNIDDEDGL